MSNNKKYMRSTCFTHKKHGEHYWTHNSGKELWCPGTDGSNPQVPKDLAKKLRRAKQKGQLS